MWASAFRKFIFLGPVKVSRGGSATSKQGSALRSQDFLWGSLLLAAGGGLLLAWAIQVWIVWSSWYFPYALVGVFTLPAVLVHGLAWLYLWWASHGSRLRTTLFSVAIFVVVVSTLLSPYLAPAALHSSAGTWTEKLLTSAPFLPYLPSVFGPVVILQCLLLASVLPQMGRRYAKLLGALGIAYLIAVTSVSLWAQILVVNGSWLLGPEFFVFAGATSGGYLMIAGGWGLRKAEPRNRNSSQSG